MPLGTDHARYQDRLEQVVVRILNIHQAGYGFIALVLKLFKGMWLKHAAGGEGVLFTVVQILKCSFATTSKVAVDTD